MSWQLIMTVVAVGIMLGVVAGLLIHWGER